MPPKETGSPSINSRSPELEPGWREEPTILWDPNRSRTALQHRFLPPPPGHSAPLKNGCGATRTSSARRGGKFYERRDSGSVLVQFWTYHVRNEIDLANSIQTTAFSFAIAVMDRVGGWFVGNEEKPDWIDIRGVHVGLHKGCCLQRPKTRDL